MFCAVVAVCIGSLTAAENQASPGPFAFKTPARGVNYYDLFVRQLKPDAPVAVPDPFQWLATNGVAFVRFSAGGYWPVEWGLYQTNRTEHWRRMDAVVRAAETNRIGLVPSLFWNWSTVPDLVGEPANARGDTHSRTIRFMRDYTREMVTRYVDSPAIWMWELGNEYNLVADLPNAAEHRPPVVPELGTPRERSAKDEVTHAMVRTALRECAATIDDDRSPAVTRFRVRQPGIRNVNARGRLTPKSNSPRCSPPIIPTR